MIGSLFKDLSPIPNDEDKDSALTEDLSSGVDTDDNLLTALPVVQKIVRRNTVFSWQSEASDLVQGIALRLVKWRDKYREKSAEMSPDEWQAFAAQTAYNEINRHNKNNSAAKAVPLDSVQEAAAAEVLEGQSEAEVCSLVRVVWQEICRLSLRQRRALLLADQDIIINFLTCGISDQELAEILNLNMEEWETIKEKLPLKNFQIAELIKKEGNEKSLESIINSIKKARHEARAKMRRLTDK